MRWIFWYVNYISILTYVILKNTERPKWPSHEDFTWLV